MFKVVLKSFLAFIIGVGLIILFDYKLQRLIREIYIIALGDKIKFFGKYFYFFASEKILLSFGLLALFFFRLNNKKQFAKLIKSVLVFIATFFVLLFIITYLKAKLNYIECTACEEGVLRMQFKSVKYDSIIILSSIFALLPSLIQFLLSKRRK
jgi:hypothetical protein